MNIEIKMQQNKQVRVLRIERIAPSFILVQSHTTCDLRPVYESPPRENLLYCFSTIYTLRAPFSIGYSRNFKGLNLWIPHPTNCFEGSLTFNKQEGFLTFLTLLI
jgi:hypothetical protein